MYAFHDFYDNFDLDADFRPAYSSKKFSLDLLYDYGQKKFIHETFTIVYRNALEEK